MQPDQDNGLDDIGRIVFDTFHRGNDGCYFALTAAAGKLRGGGPMANEIFRVVNEGCDTSADRFRPTRNDTSLKGAWTYRF